MKIGTKYQIISDSTNVTLQERGYNKTKKEHYWTNIGYFGNPRNALRFLVEHEILGTGFEDFAIVVKKIDELEKLIRAIPQKVLPELVQAKSDSFKDK